MTRIDSKKTKNRVKLGAVIVSGGILVTFTLFFIIFGLPILMFLTICGDDGSLYESLHFTGTALSILWGIISLISVYYFMFVYGSNERFHGNASKGGVSEGTKMNLAVKYDYTAEEVDTVYKYIQQARLAGHTKDVIIKELSKAGWQEEFVREILTLNRE